MQGRVIFIVIFADGTLLSPFSCFAESPEADAIFFGGDIVTINDAQASAEAVAIKDGKVLAVGNLSEIKRAKKGALTRAIDLAGRTLLPSFIDAYSHYLSSLTVANQVNVYAPPSGPGKDVAGIVAALVKSRDTHKISKGELIQPYGYDENVMQKGKVLTKEGRP